VRVCVCVCVCVRECVCVHNFCGTQMHQKALSTRICCSLHAVPLLHVFTSQRDEWTKIRDAFIQR